jgi:hypothetical protein
MNTHFIARTVCLLCLWACFNSVVPAQDQPKEPPQKQEAEKQDPIDFNKARELRRKRSRGGKLTPEEQEFLKRAEAAFRARQRRNRAGRRPGEPVGKLPEGVKPLTDMKADEKYKGEEGGLYGGRKNTPPDAHRKAALQQAKLIQPLDENGKPAADGKIVLISNGMSNTTQEFSQFMRLARSDDKKSPQVVIVDGAQGGMEALAWAKPETNSRRGRSRDPWKTLDQRLETAGVSPQQVQVVWIKQARRSPAQQGEFPEHAREMKGHMIVILNELNKRFPNLRIAYLSNRIYAGYARSALNPEPYAYETAFVNRWLIQDQIEGDSKLNYAPEKGKVTSPLLLWGPYLWANGKEGRQTDDLVWLPEDFANDGTHPSQSGRQKVAKMLLEFFRTDPTAKLWYLKNSAE